MSKKLYTVDIKLQIIKYVVDEKHSIGEAVEHFKIPYQSMRMSYTYSNQIYLCFRQNSTRYFM